MYIITGAGKSRSHNNYKEDLDNVPITVHDDGIEDCRDSERVSKSDTVGMIKDRLNAAPLNSEVNHVYRKVLKGIEGEK